VDERLAALATAYVLLMAVFGPVGARVVEPLAQMVRKRRALTTTT
jgi:CPA2 family monovalent cation:H+ antiporter-2